MEAFKEYGDFESQKKVQDGHTTYNDVHASVSQTLSSDWEVLACVDSADMGAPSITQSIPSSFP
jgi:hypothetical protein